MSRPCYALRQPTRQEATKWLRRKLAMVRDEAPPPKARSLRAWLAGALRLSPDELQPGLAVAVRLVVDASVWIGDVRDATETTLELLPWGAAREMVVAISDIAAIKLVPEHSWAEQQRVIERQRRGEPADVMVRAKRPT